MKILYAAANNSNAKIVLERTYPYLHNHTVKIAAYRKSSPPNISIDWTLDCLYNIYCRDLLSLDRNNNVSLYYDEIKRYSPDLIISDLERTTSYIANSLNIPLWQYSSLLTNYAITNEDKNRTGIFNNYSLLTTRKHRETAKIVSIINNSECNFLYSHICDTNNPCILKDNFSYIRPYHKVGIESSIKNNIITYLPVPSKKILSYINKYDPIVYSDFIDEKYNFTLRKIDNNYYNDLINCKLVVCEGQESILADAYYNNKFSIAIPIFDEAECVVSSMYSEYHGLSKLIFDSKDLPKYFDKQVNSFYNENVKYLHEKIAEL